ncbi:AraC family transcriptional regulator [Aquimarina sp. ERC-38]|uniref:helix-turn-helix domain-containing protein n=1 Tax=Aquimarina sp. ERC-38 TaxID=2949996 RepID=UPI002246C343|nr:AraC family transcriptional regulator [Aquimarina sp. ERC-38]UZO79299.1 AraC family transcriptional regulator [Aquimarina sp. ERC-38]
MNKMLSIKDTTVRDIVVDMAKYFEVSVKESFNVISIILPEHIGTGEIKGTSFDSGIGVIEAFYSLHDDLIIELAQDNIHPLKFIFNIGQNIQHQFKGLDGDTTIKTFENLIVSNNNKYSNIFKIPKSENISLFSIEINRKQFHHKLKQFEEGLEDSLKLLFNDLDSKKLIWYKASCSLEIADIIYEYKNCELEGFMRSFFLENKANEILYNQLLQYLDDDGETSSNIPRNSDIKYIEAAASFIKDNVSESMSVSNIAKIVGISQKKLQRGFQSHFKLSINDYIKEKRMEKLVDLLINTDLSISEISYEIGIQSKSYVSKLFKDKYGVSPKTYRKIKRDVQLN